MKFTNQLEIYQIPEWRRHYLDYKFLRSWLWEIVGDGSSMSDSFSQQTSTGSMSGSMSTRPSTSSTLGLPACYVRGQTQFTELPNISHQWPG